MGRHGRVRLIWVLVVTLGISFPCAAAAEAQDETTARAPLGLKLEFADGKNITRPVQSRGGMWTANFPRIAGAETSKDGVPLKTLDLRHRVEGTTVLVQVALSYSGPGKGEVIVATVRVTPDAPVRVEQLRGYGVEPVTLSIVPLAATLAHAPVASSPSGNVDVHVQPLLSSASAYRVVVTNRSPVPLMWFEFKAYRGEQEALSSTRAGDRNHPLVQPGSEFTYDFTYGTSRATGDGQAVWEPFDRFVITSIVWQDGLVEGDAVRAVMFRRITDGRASNLRTLIAILEGASGQSTASLRPRIAGSMSFDPQTQQFRGELLADLDALERTGRSVSGLDFANWVKASTTEAKQWLARTVLPKNQY